MADKFSMLPTVKFYEIWANSLKKEEGEQWHYMLAACFEAFKARSNNDQVYADWKKGRSGSDQELIKSFMDAKVYAKVTALRRTLKKKYPAKTPPAYPSGRSQASTSKSIDYDAVWAFFD